MSPKQCSPALYRHTGNLPEAVQRERLNYTARKRVALAGIVDLKRYALSFEVQACGEVSVGESLHEDLTLLGEWSNVCLYKL